jgi:hypothetical protein
MIAKAIMRRTTAPELPTQPAFPAMRRFRAFIIVLALGISGGAAVGVLAMLLVALGALVYLGPFSLSLAPFVIGETIDAMCGAVLAPLLGFSILRHIHIPLGRAIGWCTVDALAGGGVRDGGRHPVSARDGTPGNARRRDRPVRTAGARTEGACRHRLQRGAQSPTRCLTPRDRADCDTPRRPPSIRHMSPRPWRAPPRSNEPRSPASDGGLTTARARQQARERVYWRVGGLVLLAGIALTGYLAATRRATPGRAAAELPDHCARAYAKARTAAESAAVDGITTSVSRRSGPSPNCGFYRGQARLDSITKAR